MLPPEEIESNQLILLHRHCRACNVGRCVDCPMQAGSMSRREASHAGIRKFDRRLICEQGQGNRLAGPRVLHARGMQL
jgi:hypothetical protein